MAELFTNTRQNTVFTSVGSRLSGMLGSARGIHLWAFRTHCSDKPKFGLSRSGKTRVKCNQISHHLSEVKKYTKCADTIGLGYSKIQKNLQNCDVVNGLFQIIGAGVSLFKIQLLIN